MLFTTITNNAIMNFINTIQIDSVIFKDLTYERGSNALGLMVIKGNFVTINNITMNRIGKFNIFS